MDTPRLTVVGLSGKAGSGKNYIATRFFRPRGWMPFALAWAIKNEGLGGIPQESGYFIPSYSDMHHRKPPAVRDWLQNRGTENGWVRFDSGYWPRIALGWMTCLAESWGVSRFVITDVRFPHEVEWVRELGGDVVRITGRGGLEGAAGLHRSETALDVYPFTLYLDNSPGRSDFELQRDLLRQLAKIGLAGSGGES